MSSTTASHSVERTLANRFAQAVFIHQWRLARAARHRLAYRGTTD